MRVVEIYVPPQDAPDFGNSRFTVHQIGKEPIIRNEVRIEQGLAVIVPVSNFALIDPVRKSGKSCDMVRQQGVLYREPPGFIKLTAFSIGQAVRKACRVHVATFLTCMRFVRSLWPAEAVRAESRMKGP